MGHTACTEPQCLYKGDLYLYICFVCAKSWFFTQSVQNVAQNKQYHSNNKQYHSNPHVMFILPAVQLARVPSQRTADRTVGPKHGATQHTEIR